MDHFYSLCLQGDLNSAMDYLDSIQPRTKEIEEIQQMYIERFYSQEPAEPILEDDQWIKEVLAAYHHYFQGVLTKADLIHDAELTLNDRLRMLLKVESPFTIDETENELAAIFTEKGYHFLGGVTPPFRGAYIWKRCETVDFNVEIPHRSITVTVHMMSDFLLEGWIGFATFNNRTVGGWAKEDGLYCNVKSYNNLGDDDFQVCYLKHEAQHLSDYSCFPGLTSAELEYRAKLVELIYTKNHSILNKFLNDAKNDPDFPHPYASYNLIKNISSKILEKDYESNMNVWLAVDYQKISSAALELFDENTSALKRSAVEKETPRGQGDDSCITTS
ncbi:hypothetical protein LC048_19295 [Mesobacillus subterraneus]|uniref:hypothetical protein n=1 Tax=Mesobacillus subterraneus TaxID=285983 RepID=UPI001CFEA3BA|nr:hypothetical protein [Mesobacillus subterraneus]WLR54548.1 hypothetical protein LC048_19295 [Mesobacillus subterraneus]